METNSKTRTICLRRFLCKRFVFFFSRFQFNRDEIQAFREEHEQRNGDLTKPDEEISATNTKVSSIKRPMDLRWSINFKDALPTLTTNPITSATETSADVFRDSKSTTNDPSDYR